MFTNEDFIKRLKALRTESGWSQFRLSLAVDRNPSYVEVLERNGKLPRMDDFLKICEVLEIEPHDFFDTNLHNPSKYTFLLKNLKLLSKDHFDLIADIVKVMLLREGKCGTPIISF